MTTDAHLAELERRHRSLDQAILAAEASPSTDHIEIVEMKRRKLHLKEAIERLKAPPGELH